MNEPIRTELGKISSVRYGVGGYNDAMHGISFTLEGKGWGVQDFWGAWGAIIDHTDHCKWSEEDRIKQHGEIAMRISWLLQQAKKEDIGGLRGLPIEATFQGGGMGLLKSWRVLEEVL